jgi:hypothetical protein
MFMLCGHHNATALVPVLFADIEEGTGNAETNANEKNAALEQYDALFGP